MSTLIRFETTDERGPSGKLWGNLVDWVKGVQKGNGASTYFNDFTPYNAGDITISGDTGGAVAIQAEPLGVVEITATQAADAVSGFQLNEYVDFDAAGFREAVIETCIESVADAAANEAFVGWTDEALDGFYGTDNTPDGSALGLRWNTDETVDLVSISAADAITVLYHEVATGVERTDGRAKLGIRVRKETATRYTVIASVNGVTVRVSTTTIPGEPMLPTVAGTNDNGAAPAYDCDWIAHYNNAAAV